MPPITVTHGRDHHAQGAGRSDCSHSRLFGSCHSACMRPPCPMPLVSSSLRVLGRCSHRIASTTPPPPSLVHRACLPEPCFPSRASKQAYHPAAGAARRPAHKPPSAQAPQRPHHAPPTMPSSHDAAHGAAAFFGGAARRGRQLELLAQARNLAWGDLARHLELA